MNKTLRALALAGFTAASITAGFPQAAKAQTTQTYTTSIQVQNLNQSAPAVIQIDFYKEDSSTPAATIGSSDSKTTIAAGGQSTWAPLPSSVLGAGFKGSAIISSDEPVAAVVSISSPNPGSSFGNGSYMGFTTGSNKFYLPLLFKGFGGYSTIFSVQNIGDADANVTITHRGLQGSTAVGPFTQKAVIKPNTAKEFNQELDGAEKFEGGTVLPSNYNGAAIIESDQPIVASVIQVLDKGTDPQGVKIGQIFGYGGFPDTAISKTPVFPIFQANNFGYITGISVQNVGSQSTSVTVSYTPTTSGTACTETVEIPAGGKQNFGVFAFAARGSNPGTDDCSDSSVDSFVGIAKVTNNSNNQDLVAVVNQLSPGGNKGDSYGAFSPSAGTNTVVFPLINDRFFGFFTGYGIYNNGTVETSVECTFSNSTKKHTFTLAAGAGIVTPHLPAFGLSEAGNYNGSATCVASAAGARIVGVGQQVSLTPTGDTFTVYEGVNR